MDDKEERNIQSKGKNNMNKVIIVTGGSRGIGASIVRLLAKDDNKVILNYNKSEESAKRIQKELEKESIKIDIFKADVSKKADVLAMISYVIVKYHRIDVLINNAGISQERLFTDINDEEWNEIIDVNLNSVFYCTKSVIPYMIQKKCGCIINISSIWGVTGGSCEVGYSTSKAAIIGLSKALAKEMGPSNIRINCIAPGIIDTDMNRNLNDDDIEAIKGEIPLNRIGLTEDIAKCAKWLIEDNYTTGQVININGGWYI